MACRTKLVAAFIVVISSLVTGTAGQVTNTTIYNPYSEGFGYVLGYDSLTRIYNAYKYGVPFSALQVKNNNSLYYAVCQTLAARPGDNVVVLHPTFPLNQTIDQITAAGFPLAINQATAINQVAASIQGDRSLFQANFPYGPSGSGTTPTFRKSVEAITIYGTYADIGKIFTCSIGVQATGL